MNYLLKIIKSTYFWLFLIILLGFGLRIFYIDRSIADWHSWRQADSAAVARSFYQEGFNPFIPKYDDMTPPGNLLLNVDRYRFVEFPIYQIVVYGTYLLNGGVEVTYARLVSVLFSLGSIVIIFLIVRRQWSVIEALMASLLFAVIPFNVYFSRTTLPEPTLIFFSLAALYFTDRWIWENTIKLFFLSVFFAAGALLLKPMAVFFFLPLLYSYVRKEKRIIPPMRYILWVVLVIAPFAGWRLWMQRFPEGIPASEWLLNGNDIRFRPAFWRWIIVDRLGREILSVTGVVLLVIGFLRKLKPQENYLLHLFLLSMFAYLCVFATGNVQHDYYQILIVPALAIFCARGFIALFSKTNDFIPRIFTIPTAIFLLTISLLLTFLEIKGFYQINNNSIVKAGEYADKNLPKNAVVIAPWGGDSSFLYQVNRPGFAVMAASVEDLKRQAGVTHFISVNYDNDARNVMNNYSVIEENPDFVVVDVTKPKEEK